MENEQNDLWLEEEGEELSEERLWAESILVFPLPTALQHCQSD